MDGMQREKVIYLLILNLRHAILKHRYFLQSTAKIVGLSLLFGCISSVIYHVLRSSMQGAVNG